MATINYNWAGIRTAPPHTLLIPFKHTLKILIVNGGVGGRRSSNRGENSLEWRLGTGVCCMTLSARVCVSSCVIDSWTS